MGVRIGWLTGDDVLLDESASYRVAEQIFDAGPLLMNERAVRLHLRKWGLLASIDTARQVLLVRRTLEGRPRSGSGSHCQRATQCEILTAHAYR